MKFRTWKWLPWILKVIQIYPSFTWAFKEMWINWVVDPPHQEGNCQMRNMFGEDTGGKPWADLRSRVLSSDEVTQNPLSVVLVAQLCRTLCNSIDYSPPGSSVHGILQAKILEWIAIPFSRGSSWPRDWTHISHVSCIAGIFFTPEPSLLIFIQWSFHYSVSPGPPFVYLMEFRVNMVLKRMWRADRQSGRTLVCGLSVHPQKPWGWQSSAPCP